MTEEVNKEFKKLVLWKLETEVPHNFKLSIGSSGTFTVDELIKNIKEDSEIGKLYVKTELDFIKALMSGEISNALTE
jgi:hypothetical protein